MTEQSNIPPESILPPPEWLIGGPETLEGTTFIERKFSYYSPTKLIGKDGSFKSEGRLFIKLLYQDLLAYCDMDYLRIKDEIEKGYQKVLSKDKINGKERRAYDKIFQSLMGKFDFEVGIASAYFVAKKEPEKEEKRKSVRIGQKEGNLARKTFKDYFKEYCASETEDLNDPDKERAFLAYLTQFDKSIREITGKENEVETRRLESMIASFSPALRPRISRNSLLRRIWLGAASTLGIGALIGIGFGFISGIEINTSSMSVKAAEAAADLAVSVPTLPTPEPKRNTPEVVVDVKKNNRISEDDAIRFGRLTQQRLNRTIPPSAVLAILDIESNRGANIGEAIGPAQITQDTLNYIRRDFVKIMGREPDPENSHDAILLSGIVLKKYGWKTDDQNAMMRAVKKYGGFGNKQDSPESGKYWIRFINQYQSWKNKLGAVAMK